MATPQENLERLASLLKMMDEGLTKKDFVAAFDLVGQVVLKLEAKILGDSSQMATDLANFKAEMRSNQDASLADLKAAGQQAIGEAITEMLESADRRMRTMEARIGSVQDGKDADEERMLATLKESIPTIEQLAQFLPQASTGIRDALELLEGDERLDISAIRGLKEALDDAKKTGKAVNFVGGARGIYVYINGIKKGIMNTLNFTVGPALSLSYSKVNGLDTLTFDASGSGITVETPPEAPAGDGSVLVFTFTAEPKWIVSDGTTLYEGSGYSWDGVAKQATMINGPTQFIRGII